MPIARVRNKILHFIHIPKTGGSYVTSYLRAIGQVALHSRTPVSCANTTPQHMDIATSKILLPLGFVDHRFAVIRDPLDRILSEFRYRFTRAAQPEQSANGHKPENAVLVELDWGQTFFGTFEEWVDLVFEMYQADPTVCDNHIRPQSDFVDAETKLFRFENGIDTVLDWIDSTTGTLRRPFCIDQNESQRLQVNIPNHTRDKIIDFYRSDYRMINRLVEANPAVAALGEQRVDG